MTSAKDTLHRFIDSLPDEELQRVERLLQSSPLPDRLDLATLIRQQDFRLLDNLADLTEGVWPEDESVEDFLSARESWRHESETA